MQRIEVKKKKGMMKGMKVGAKADRQTKGTL